MGTILVVGGAGFIGSHVNKRLNDAGYKTVVFDNLSRGDARAVTAGTFVKGDMASDADLTALFKANKFDAVMHFAALTDVGESVQNPDIYYENNIENTRRLLKHMRENHVKNFIFSSSAAVYGTPPDSSSIDETFVCQPINPYGRTKWIVEQMLADYAVAYGLHYCALRYFNAAGGDPDGVIKNYKTRENNLIPLALRSLLKPDGQLTVFGNDYETPDGTCIRDYIHVADLADAHIHAMRTLLDGAPSNIYNLGNGNGYSVKEVIDAVQRVTGLTLNVIQGDRRLGDPAILIANPKKAMNELAWQPQYQSLEQMVQHAWDAIIKE